MTAARDLADRFYRSWLNVNPFDATADGVTGYDDMVPDSTVEGRNAWQAEALGLLREADALSDDLLAPDDAVTLGCVREAAAAETAIVDMAHEEYTVTAMHFAGPAAFLALVARTVLVDPAAAAAYVVRLRRCGVWIDQMTARLRAGAGRGRLPVARLAEQAVSWAERVLAAPENNPVLSPRPPQEWSRAAAWEQERRTVATEVVNPALSRWVETVKDLVPRARASDRIGLAWLPDGDADYARAIRVYTTLPLSANALHALGLEHLEALEEQAVKLGAQLGLHSRGEVFTALRMSAEQSDPQEAMRRAAAAIRRAEARAAEYFPAPLPPHCDVTPMPEVVAAAGAAPHYTPPRLDGGRAGTFWFNTKRATAGAGWDLEAVAFHEAVPGHHLQMSRLRLLDGLPELQRLRSVQVFSEGWGLYAEHLAEEAGLYSDTCSLLGAVCTNLMRAVRLVVDTGIHAFGWSREQALDFAISHVPLPPQFLADEIDRYTIMPGQALAYLTGKLEMLRIREETRRRLGADFALPAFHAAILDHGSLPMPVLDRSVAAWINTSNDHKAGRT